MLYNQGSVRMMATQIRALDAAYGDGDNYDEIQAEYG